MGRSQRHLLQEHNTTSAGEIHAQGEIASSVVVQVESTPQYGGLEMRGLDLTVPEGPPGGPLQGSSMSGAIPEGMAPIPGPEPEPGAEPTLTGLDPDMAVIGDPDLTLNVYGTNFTASSIIMFNGGAENTVFVSDTNLQTTVKPSTATIEGAFPVTVMQGSFETNAIDFTFTTTMVQASGRELPAGPFNLLRVDPDPNQAGVWYTLSDTDGAQLRAGDTVRVEATTNTDVNGDFTVGALDTSTAGQVSFLREGVPLSAPLIAKGRLTVLSEA